MPAPVVAVALWTFIVGVLPGLLRSLFLLLGITAVTYTGFTAAADAIISFIDSQLSGLPAQALQIFGILRIDIAIAMILSAYVATFVLGSVTRWRKGSSGIFTQS